jgi:hypothetical protein
MTISMGPRPPPSSYSARSLSSPVTSGSNTPQRQKSASRASTSRKHNRRKSKASLRVSTPISVRSSSSTRGDSGTRNARSKSRSKKGKEPAQVEPPVPWIPSDVEGSFLEMEGRRPETRLVVDKSGVMAGVVIMLVEVSARNLSQTVQKQVRAQILCSASPLLIV